MAERLDLTVDLGRGLRLRSPVLVASGTFGYGFDAPQVDRIALGAIVTKGTTLRPREGNVPNRIAETPSGMLNAIGLQNPGVDHVARVYAPVWASWNVPVIVNVAGDAIDEYVAVAERLDSVPGIAGLELNISCPNVANGLQFGVDPDQAAKLTSAVRAVTRLTLIVKLTPNVTDVVAIYPTTPEVPLNLLRLYVHFSNPMSEGWSARAVQIRHAETRELIGRRSKWIAAGLLAQQQTTHGVSPVR